MATSSPATAPDKEWDAEAIKDWVVAHGKPLSIGGGALVVAVAAFLFWQQANRIKNERAETAFGGAQGAFYSGNTALAKSDLEKVVTRYPGTAGGTQATMLLAQILYGEAKYDDGIKLLTGIQSGAPAQFAASVEELIAAGHGDAKRPADAAAHYLKAAEKAPFPADKAIYKAEAARMYGLAGKNDEARKLWEALAADRDSPVLNEAKVRLGELSAKAASK